MVPATTSGLLTSLAITYNDELADATLISWIIIFLVSSVTMALALTPSTFIALCSGYFLGWQGLLYFIPSYLIASIIAWFFAGLFNFDSLLEYLNEKPKVRTFIKTLERSDRSFVFVGRLSPILPFALMNLIFRTLKIRFKIFFVFGGLGMLPRSILALWTGTQIQSFMSHSFWSNENIVGKIAFISFILISIVYFGLKIRKSIIRR